MKAKLPTSGKRSTTQRISQILPIQRSWNSIEKGIKALSWTGRGGRRLSMKMKKKSSRNGKSSQVAAIVSVAWGRVSPSVWQSSKGSWNSWKI